MPEQFSEGDLAGYDDHPMNEVVYTMSLKCDECGLPLQGELKLEQPLSPEILGALGLLLTDRKCECGCQKYKVLQIVNPTQSYAA
jgi:hypothetical protein